MLPPSSMPRNLLEIYATGWTFVPILSGVGGYLFAVEVSGVERWLLIIYGTVCVLVGVVLGVMFLRAGVRPF